MYPNQNITPGVAWSQGIQKVVDQQSARRDVSNSYNQGYNQGVDDAWLHANKKIATLNQTITNFKQALVKMEKERDIAQADHKKSSFVAVERGKIIKEVKGADWYLNWRDNVLEPKAKQVYRNVLTEKGYTFK